MLSDTPIQVNLEGRLFEEQALGGISRIYHEILPRICQMDEQIRFSILTSDKLMQSLPSHSQIVSCPSSLPLHRLLRPKKIFWKIQDYVRAKIQVGLTNSGKDTIWHATYFQLPGWWRGPKIVSVYDLIYEKYPELFNKDFDHVFRKRKKHAILAADKVICISESVRSDVIEVYGISPDRVVAIPLACGDNFKRMSKEEIAPDFRVDRPFIFFFGRRSHHKNFETLLKAYALWPRRNEINLTVVGSPWLKEEQEEIVSLGLEENIILRTGVSDEGLCALYNQALAFVYPSLSEGFGIPLLEAMACGCPIVASRIPTSVEVAGNVPYFFGPLNVDELILALDEACFSRKIIKAEDILAKYSWDNTARETLGIYKELTGHV